MKWKDSSSCAKYKTKQSNERAFEFARDINDSYAKTFQLSPSPFFGGGRARNVLRPF